MQGIENDNGLASSMENEGSTWISSEMASVWIVLSRILIFG